MEDDGFDQFAMARLHALSRVAYLLTCDHHAAEELLQNALVMMAGQWKRVAAAADPLAYARRLLYHEHVSGWRRDRHRRAEYSTDQLPERAGVRDEASDTVRRVVMRHARVTGIRNLLDEVADEARVYAVVASAKAGARRRRRVRRMLAAGTASVAVLGMATGVYIAVAPDSGVGAGPAASAEPSASPTAPGVAFPTGCSAEQLHTPEGYLPRGVVTGMDPTGRFVLGRAYPANGQRSVLVWDNGAVTAVSMPGSEPALVDANSAGLAVGYTHAANDTFQAYVYRDGTLTKLADRAQAFEVNEAGAIFGQVWSGATQQPVLWPSASAQPVPLALPADIPSAILTQFADDGAVIGYLVSEDFAAVRPVLWHPDGSRVDLQWPSLPGPEGQAARAHGLRAGRGEWAVVEVYAEQAPLPATYVWNVRTGQTRPMAEASDLVGTLAWSIVRSHTHPDASLVSGQHSLTLPRLPGVDYDGDPLRISLNVSGISEDGHLIAADLTRAHATFGYDDLLPLVWHCG